MKTDPAYVEQLQITYVQDGKHMRIQADQRLKVQIDLTTPEPDWLERSFGRPKGDALIPTYVVSATPEEDGTVFTLYETPNGIWSESGIHLPTMEAVELVLSQFVGIDDDVLKQFREAVLGGGPL